MNVKQIVVSSTLDEPTSVYLSTKKAGKVTAGDINTPTGIEIHNPDLVLCTLSKDSELGVEFVVDRGRGYVSADNNKGVNEEVGRIPVDSIYTPVVKVSYKVEATRVEQRTDYDRLIVDVETKPSISPTTAFASAGATLVELFGLVKSLDDSAEGVELAGFADDADLLLKSLEELDLTSRASKGLNNAGIRTVGDLVEKSKKDLEALGNFGAKSIEDVEAKLAELGLSLKGSAVAE